MKAPREQAGDSAFKLYGAVNGRTSGRVIMIALQQSMNNRKKAVHAAGIAIEVTPRFVLI